MSAFLTVSQLARLVVVGDSLSVYPTIAECWPERARSLLPEWEVMNLAVGGKKLSEMLAEFPTGAALALNPNAARNVLVVLGGTNDILFAEEDAGEIFANWRALHQLATEAGFEVVGCTVPASAVMLAGSDKDNARLALNDLLRGYLHPRRLVDLAHPAFRWANFADTADGTWFIQPGDGTHPTAASAQAWAALILPVVLCAPPQAPSCELVGGQFRLAIPGLPGMALVVQSS